MRIISKYTDFYDSCQYIYPDDTFTFDRTNAVLLDKHDVCLKLPESYAYNRYCKHKHVYGFILLQIGATFWLLASEYTKFDFCVTDYELHYLTSWKNYDLPRELIKISVISFPWGINNQICGSFRGDFYDLQVVQGKLDILIQAINTKDYEVRSVINKSSGALHIPILCKLGFQTCLNPMEVYQAFDEYFSLEKTASEKIEADGTTDKDRILNHGFDDKVSFRKGKSD